GGSEDAFVVKLSSSGSHLIYSTFLGGISLESGHGIALDSVGNAFVTGITTSANFPVKNAFQPHCAAFCAFVSKLDSNGRLVYSTFLGGGSENGTGIAVTPAGQAYATGHTESPLFPTTQTAFQRVFRGAADIFLTKLDPAGKLVYSTYAGENGALFPVAVALDRDTNAYLTGAADFDNSGDLANFPITPGAFQQKPGGGGDAFVAKVVSLCALSTVNRTVTICVPANGSTVKSPVNIIAGTTDVTPARITQIYLDGKKIFEARLSAINVSLPMAGGTHRLTVQALDTASVFFKKTISVTVSPH
ncbi:MAG: SBBP repeat-containing protein, partial [Candidatus Angelobacter sp.]